MSIDFESPLGPGTGTRVADAIGKTPDGGDVGILVWGDDLHVRSLEIYDLDVASSRRLPDPDSIKPWG